ncbi:MAG: acyltransferase 3 [Rhizobacter sp.]|nr:acyltransferase 3 [Rhizobacter sp.]
MFKSIQACRAAAALLVLMFHLGGTVALDRYFGAKSFDTAFAFGDAGVPFFFVLSGFVIMLAHRRDIGRPQRFGEYVRKRATRIYPAYLIVACAVYLVAIAVPSTRDSMPHDALTLIKSALLLPQDINVVGGTGSPILIVARTLQYEVFFYALTALLILRPSLWMAAVGLLAVNFVSMRLGGPSAFPLDFLASESVPLFGFGMVTAWVSTGPAKFARPMLLAAVGVIAFLGLGAFEDVTTLRVAHRDLYYGLASCLLIVGLVRTEAASAGPWRIPKLALLGDASYALYLIHFPLISVVCKAVRATGLKGNAGASVAVVACVALSLAAAVCFHLWVEKPIMKRLSSKRRTSALGPSPVSQVSR